MTFRSLALTLLTIVLLAGCGSLRTEKGETCLAIEAGIPLPQPQFFKLPSVERPVRFSVPVESELYVTPRNLPFVRNLLASIELRAQAEPRRPYHVLALSAGGEVGAYGAGVVAGWKFNTANPRPSFDLVSGISTGALLAPLIFLHEDLLAKRLYTTIAADEVYRPRSIIGLLFGNSLADTTPLRNKVESIVTDDFVERIAAEGRTGRILAVQAVDLDAGNSVVFDLTAIAEGTNHPLCSELSRRECIIKALLAAAAVPVAFPPEFIDGEMFVDGALLQHVFTINIINGVLHSPTAARRGVSSPQGFALRLPQTPDPEAVGIDLTLIANTTFSYPITCTGNNLRDIAERSSAIATDQLAIESFFRLLAETQSFPGSNAKFTYADPELTKCHLSQTSPDSLIEPFDPKYMRCLFHAGCSLAAAGADIWHTQPTDLPHSPLPRQPINGEIAFSGEHSIARETVQGDPPAICTVAH